MTDTSIQDGYKESVAGFFNGRSNYRRSELHAKMAERFLQLAAPQAGERVLDIATGTGFVAIPAARLVGANGVVVGLDISQGMLEQASEAVGASGLKNIELVQADAEVHDYPVESFDLITCCNALPYMSDVPKALCRWHEWLRPGGRFVFNCWSEDSHATGRLLRTIAGKHGISVPRAGRDTGTPERCRSILMAAGFSRSAVVVEATSNYLSIDRLLDVFEAAKSSPLFGVAPEDQARVEELREEYITALQSLAVRESLGAEMGAYFVTAYR